MLVLPGIGIAAPRDHHQLCGIIITFWERSGRSTEHLHPRSPQSSCAGQRNNGVLGPGRGPWAAEAQGDGNTWLSHSSGDNSKGGEGARPWCQGFRQRSWVLQQPVDEKASGKLPMSFYFPVSSEVGRCCHTKCSPKTRLFPPRSGGGSWEQNTKRWSRERAPLGRHCVTFASDHSYDISSPWMDTVQRQRGPDLHTPSGETLKAFLSLKKKRCTNGKAKLCSQQLPGGTGVPPAVVLWCFSCR